MKKVILSLIMAVMLVPTSVKADEGMWFLMFIERLNHRDMQKMGLQLTAEEIYSINNSSIKDAIVQFNGGCTAEIVSKEGLVLTNHHCGYDAIAELSSPTSNYLRDGFWAKDKKAELKPESLYVRFFVRMDDVSKRILSKVNNQMTEAEREKAINQEIAVIQKENDGGGKYTVSVRPFFQGNEYYYFVYQDYTDVRLVGTPPENIGKFGGDTDNWEWPRHTGDFSLFRVYADKDGNPAEYSANNVPLKPKHHLPVSLKGVKENDFAMILGYPGRTNRWMPSGGIEQNVKFAYPAWVEGSKVGMDAMKKHMDQSDAVRLKYASNYASVANYWKNRQGMIDALTKFGTADTKAKTEAEFDKWANKPENKAKYGDVITNINKYYAATNEKSRHDNYLISILRNSAFAAAPANLGSAFEYLASQNDAKKAEVMPRIQAQIDGMFETMYLPLERDVLVDELNLYVKKAGYPLPTFIAEQAQMNGGDFSKFVDDAFANSIFTSKEKLDAFAKNPNLEVLKADKLYQMSMSLLTAYRAKSDELAKLENDYQKSFRLLVEGLRESKLADIKYPDANSTLRLSYGKVRALPADQRNDAKINNYTTLAGTIKKYKPNDQEFDLPKRLIELNDKKDFGRYADKAGYLPVNFLSDNDITGGNSGSPVLNGKGELIGVAFDGNIEAMAGDVIFDKNLQRTINVDIRYVLFIIDKFAGAKHIVDEMTIVK
ncbi:S46 family peptidase [Flavobacterium sp. NST-5]|uniref:Dipeptidyl-peptidase n=1 Tax=Flavobacterium ichthyis TaxID=2698827 RepID=A0ABW9Z9E5_9FLAO|nr:S46 family peptidase [Flavobacterium ichthyis]NBL65511.1 S46 family peptidase [Flavobacterium ichthyis]